MDLLLSISLRALIPAMVAAVVLWVARVKSAAARHAVWTVVTVGMLLTGLLTPVLSPIRLRILPVAPVPVSSSTVEAMVSVETPAQPPPAAFPWDRVIVIAYGAGVLVSLLRLAGGYVSTWRLVRAASPVEGDLYESRSIAVPMTTGWLRPKILLPAKWRDWDDTRMSAVLAHERAHVRRSDWAIAGLAMVNRSVFWFHPLAWWLERKLGTLAEQACDDASVLETGNPADYARVLLEMAVAVKASRGRVDWEAMAMAKAAEVSMRIDRILDEKRPLSAGVARRWRAALVGLGLPVVYCAAVFQVAPAVAQQQEQTQSRPAASEPAQAPPAQTSPPAAAPKSKPAPAPKAQPAEPFKLIHRVEPEYPKIAQQTGAKGEVEMSVTVGPDGSVTAVKVLRGHPMLQSAAVAAVKQWLYTPQPTETTTSVTLYFAGAEPGPPSGGHIQPAVLISRKEPAYPDEAKRADVQGRVVLNATINKEGHVTAVKVVRGDPLLLHAAEDAVRQWIYRPTMLNGAPVETETQITLNFAGPSATPGLETAQLMERKEPVHPGGELAHLTGTVMFRAKVGTDGRLGDIRVIDGPAELVPAALTAVKQWIYRPAKLNGQPVEAFTEIALHFTPGR